MVRKLIILFLIMISLNQTVNCNEKENQFNGKLEIEILNSNEYYKNGFKISTQNDMKNALSSIKEAKEKYLKLLRFKISAYIFLSTTIVGGTTGISFFIIGMLGIFRPFVIVLSILLPLLCGIGSVPPMIVLFAHSGKNSLKKIIKFYNNEINKRNLTLDFNIISVKI